MTERQLGHVLFRLLGLWLAVETIRSLGDVYFNWHKLPFPRTISDTWLLLGPFALYLATALVVWSWAPSLAKLTFSDAPPGSQAPAPPVWCVYRAVVAAFGLYLVATALPAIVSWLTYWLQTNPGTPERDQLVGIHGKAQGVSLLAQCLVGTLLYIGPRRMLSLASSEFRNRLEQDETS